MNDDQFRQLLDHFGYSWQGYRKVRKGVFKRLMRHMRELDVRDVDDYLARITSSPDIRMETRRLMTVSFSRFFRDRPLWKIIKAKLLPEILSPGIRSALMFGQQAVPWDRKTIVSRCCGFF
jgi:chemotaxis protein methyltransferase CheR